jgi:hypothetical protein
MKGPHSAACKDTVGANSVRGMPRTCSSTLGYDTMTRRSTYTGDISPLFSLNSPNLTACSRAHAASSSWPVNAVHYALAAESAGLLLLLRCMLKSLRCIPGGVEPGIC